VSRQITWEAQAIDQAAGFLHDDPDGVREMLDAVARLADEPSPAGSFPYGSPDRRRLRIGRYRVMYDITAEMVLLATTLFGDPAAALREHRPAALDKHCWSCAALTES
jgi:mRNA interferase RelE/StbE